MRAGSALAVCCPLSVSLSGSPSRLTTVDGTDNRSLPRGLAPKRSPSRWQQYSSRVLKWRKYHVLHTDKLLLHSDTRFYFLLQHIYFPFTDRAGVEVEESVFSSILPEPKITFFKIKRHFKSIFIWQVLEHYHFGQQQQEDYNYKPTGQLSAVYHPGSICPCK